MVVAVRRALPTVVVLGIVLGAGLASVRPSTEALPTTPIVASSPDVATAPNPGAESAFVSRINNYRANRGLNALTVHGELVSVARNWTEKMVARGEISHNPNLGNEVSAPWTKLGENVGVGYDVEGLWQAFLNSPSHHRNVVDPDWTHVGVGVVIASDNRMFTTHNFMRLEGGSAPPPPPPPPPPSATTPPPPSATAPPPPVSTTTTTTSPPVAAVPEADPDRIAAVLVELQPLLG